jgi:hypothetical protein
MCTHFGHHFGDEDGRLHPEFKRHMQPLAEKKGWFVPAGAPLEYLRARAPLAGGPTDLRRLEKALRDWLASLA